MKKLSKLLMQRPALLRATRRANLAFAYATLTGFAERLAQAGIRGRLTLRQAAPDAGLYWATLSALDGAQSVIEEHFADEALMDLADVVAFVTGKDGLDLTFRAEEVDELLVAPVRAELQSEGIVIDPSGERRDALR